MDTIFSQIIRGDIPCHKIFEDEFTFAFMDIHPIQPGHVLVVAKEAVETFEQLDDEAYLALMTTVKRVARKIKAVLKPLRVGVIIEGLDVPHVHVKVFPINSGDELRHLPDMTEPPDHEALSAMAARLRI